MITQTEPTPAPSLAAVVQTFEALIADYDQQIRAAQAEHADALAAISQQAATATARAAVLPGELRAAVAAGDIPRVQTLKAESAVLATHQAQLLVQEKQAVLTHAQRMDALYGARQHALAPAWDVGEALYRQMEADRGRALGLWNMTYGAIEVQQRLTAHASAELRAAQQALEAMLDQQVAA